MENKEMVVGKIDGRDWFDIKLKFTVILAVAIFCLATETTEGRALYDLLVLLLKVWTPLGYR
jgi:hypothetical protein